MFAEGPGPPDDCFHYDNRPVCLDPYRPASSSIFQSLSAFRSRSARFRCPKNCAFKRWRVRDKGVDTGLDKDHLHNVHRMTGDELNDASGDRRFLLESNRRTRRSVECLTWVLIVLTVVLVLLTGLLVVRGYDPDKIRALIQHFRP